MSGGGKRRFGGTLDRTSRSGSNDFNNTSGVSEPIDGLYTHTNPFRFRRKKNLHGGGGAGFDSHFLALGRYLKNYAQGDVDVTLALPVQKAPKVRRA